MELDKIENYYNQGREQGRLTRGSGNLERVRTQEIILRYLPQPPLTVLDVGGSAGVYALWLAKLGCTVHLIDLIPLHIEQAVQASAEQPDYPLASVRQGDARRLDFPDESVDAVLLLGPLYHLPERDDRVQALREAFRVLKPSGLVFAAAISRFASLMDGMKQEYLRDDYFAELVEKVLTDGEHRNPTGAPGYFTTAYFHHPDELGAEMEAAGFAVEGVMAVEGPASFIANLESFWDDERLQQRLLGFLRVIESEPSVIGATGHLLSVGKKA